MISCVLIRNFAASVEYIHQPMLKNCPLIIATDARVKRVIATSQQPRDKGVRPKITVKQALLLSPEAEVVLDNDGAYRRVAEELAEHLMQFANKVELEYQPTSTAYYLNTDTETDEIIRFVERYMRTTVTLGIGSNKLAARVAAAYPREENKITFVKHGDEKAFLAKHPVNLLPLTKDMVRRLPLLGIHKIGQLAELPKLAIWEQFGKKGKWIHDLANGIDLRSIQAYKPLKRLCIHHEFDTSIADKEIIKAVLQRISKQLATQLQGEEAHQLSLLLYQEDNALIEAHVRPKPPLHTVLYISRRLNDLLNQQVITAPIMAIRVQLSDVRVPKPRQLALFSEFEESTGLQNVVPEWAEQHKEAGFYYTEILSTSLMTLPEDRFVFREVNGA